MPTSQEWVAYTVEVTVSWVSHLQSKEQLCYKVDMLEHGNIVPSPLHGFLRPSQLGGVCVNAGAFVTHPAADSHLSKAGL